MHRRCPPGPERHRPGGHAQPGRPRRAGDAHRRQRRPRRLRLHRQHPLRLEALPPRRRREHRPRAHAGRGRSRRSCPRRTPRPIEAGLLDVCAEIDAQRYRLVPIGEDIHSHVELRLRQVLEARHPGRGEDLGRRLHTARSRNDQVATDVRLWCRDACVELAGAVARPPGGPASTAPAPGRTPSSPATPTSSRPSRCSSPTTSWPTSRCSTATWSASTAPARAADVMPLGSAALAGTTFPIRRDLAARELGFGAISRQQHGRRLRPGLRRRAGRRLRPADGPPLPPRRGPRPLGERRVRPDRPLPALGGGEQHHAPEAQPGRGRADPGQGGSRLRRPAGPADRPSRACP